MSEAYRSLFVILSASLIAFGVQRSTLGPLFQPSQYTLFRNLWIGLSALAFASGNFWVFVAGTTVAILFVSGRMKWPAAMVPGLMLCLPPYGVDIPGFGLVNYLFTLTVPRLFALLLLAPAAFVLLRSGAKPTQVRWPDRLFTGYLLLQIALTLRSETATSAMRAMFHVLIDVGLPYFVLSRALVSVAAIRQALGAIVLAAAVLAAIAILEFSKSWLLYLSLGASWGLPNPVSSYLMRDGLLRVRATAGHAIALGYVMAMALSALLAVWPALHRTGRRLTASLLLCGIVVPFSRGPWIGALAAIAVYLATGPAAVKRLAMLGSVLVGALGVATLLPGGGRIIGMLPFVGDTDRGSIDYRQLLLDVSLRLIAEDPVLGPPEYRARLAAAGLVQGEGFVDIVNSYLGIALESGVTGLVLFIGFFIAVALSLRTSIQRARRAVDEDRETLGSMGRGLLCGVVATMVIIATVSSVTTIPWLYWSFAGLCVAYARVVEASTARGWTASVRPAMARTP